MSFGRRDLALVRVVAGNGANEEVGIGRDFHQRPAHPRFAIFLISSIDKDEAGTSGGGALTIGAER
ncbi:MAG: hypothetical protein ACREFD_13725 [Stellaceae bacterium]